MFLLLVFAIQMSDASQLGALLKARYAMASGDFVKALSFCDQAISKDSEDAEAAVLKLEILAGLPVTNSVDLLKRQTDRISAMRLFYKKFPEDYRFPFALGEFLVSERQISTDPELSDPILYLNRALELMGPSDSMRGERADAWYYIGLWQYHNNSSFQAARAFREVVALDPSAEWALYYAARSLESSHQLRSALRFYEKYQASAKVDTLEFETPLPFTLYLLRLVIAPSPEICQDLIRWLKENKATGLHYQAIMRLLEVKRYPEVATLLEALPSQAHDHNYYRLNAITRMSLHQYDRLLREISEALPRFKDKTKRANLVDYGCEAAICAGDYAGLLRLRSENPDTPGVDLKLDLYSAFARCLLSGDTSTWEQALKRHGSSELLKTIENEVESSSLEIVARRSLVRLANQWRDWSLAQKQIIELYRALPSEADQNDDLAVIYYMQRDFDQSFKLYEGLIAAQPDRRDLLNNFGYFLTESGRDLTRAESLIKRALEKEPEEGAYLDSLGWVNFKLGRYEQAEKYLQQALAQDAADPERLEHIGDLYHATGREELGRASWSQAMENASDNYLKILDKLDPAL